MSADKKYGQPISFRNRCKLACSFNTLPRSDDKTKAFFRRLLVLEFNVIIPEKKQNPNLAEELLKEKPGIVKWAAIGLERLIKQNGFSASVQMDEAIADYQEDNNHVITFVGEKCLLDTESQTPISKVYREYRKFCEENGNKPLSKRNLGKQLETLYRVDLDVRTSSHRCWGGIKLKEE